jgi:hypothetical protein
LKTDELPITRCLNILPLPSTSPQPPKLLKIQGVLGVPLVYAIRHLLTPDLDRDDPEFGDDDSKYTSHDHEMITCCPIVFEDYDWDLEWDELKVKGPFVPTFLTDSKKVWAILHALFLTSSVWQHVKKFTATQDGRHLGADKVNTMVSDILSSLKLKVYQGDRKNFNFNKYCLAHVAEHNRHTSLLEYDVAPLEESIKIHYFKEGIKDPTQMLLGTPSWSTAHNFLTLTA